MLIEYREYIALVDEIQFLKKDNCILKKENSIIRQQLVKSKQKIEELSQLHSHNISLIETLHAESLVHHQDNTHQLLGQIAKTSNQTKDFLDIKFKELQNAKQTKQIEMKMGKGNIDLYELSDFVNKIRTLRKQTTHPNDLSKEKLTLPSLAKWIKCLVLFNLSQQKHQASGSMNECNIKRARYKQQKFPQRQSTNHLTSNPKHCIY